MNHSFNTKVAELYGLEEAILLENIYFWCKKNETNNKLTQGKPWTYNTVKAFNLQFKYLSPAIITRALKNLAKYELIEVGEFNANAYDHTKWYCITDKARSFFEDTDSSSSYEDNKSDCENNNPIYENNSSICENSKSNMKKSQINTTDINTDNNTGDNTNINSPGEPPEGETKVKPCEKPKPKKADSFPQEYYDQIYQAYLENYRKLYPDKGDPDIMYGYLNKSIKNALKTYGFEKVLEAVKISVNHQFLLDNGYPLSFIFGSKELPMLINRTFSTQQKSGYTGKPYYKNFDKAALADRDFFAGTEYEGVRGERD